MGLLILIVTGLLLGWLGSIVLPREHDSSISISIGAGIAGALGGGALSGSVPLLVGISPIQLLWALAGAVAAIALALSVTSHLGNGNRR